MHNNTEFIREIESVTLEVQQELVKRKGGIKGDGTVVHLELALRELGELKDMIINNRLPPKAKRRLDIIWHITDSWKNHTPLGDHLLALERKYIEDLD